MAGTTWEYGNELQGNGDPSRMDVFNGCVVLVLAFLAVSLGILNLHIIRKMAIFHNAFGWFWASRTVGEVGLNLSSLLYAAPLTILQPKGIPVELGFVLFSLGYFFGCEACVMHQFVSLNRFVAVFFPIKYKLVFSKRLCKLVILLCWLQCAVVNVAYYAFPCNMVGYSPQHYDYVFVKCDPVMERDYSVVGTFVNRFCLVICSFTVVLDLVTLCRILYINKFVKVAQKAKNFDRDVRFFAQTSIQNVTMVISLLLVVTVNNSVSSSSKLLKATAFNSFILTSVNNALALILFNPEVRHKYGIRFPFRTYSVPEPSNPSTSKSWKIAPRA
ncbi:hypothetical protein QR680_016839 [Steinernema hermaphroditum]|uniref:G-protein coupled receptors family 1 profile domain-containing protein n=1 Tax=Steinernema hermaphroditum TaxID=289476 RepID=A0AA39HDE4_9BILA|nr:hypothetical protein QR680_016839 [Steinernema hermaphroditum]